MLFVRRQSEEVLDGHGKPGVEGELDQEGRRVQPGRGLVGQGGQGRRKRGERGRSHNGGSALDMTGGQGDDRHRHRDDEDGCQRT